jgi:DNA processing protein
MKSVTKLVWCFSQVKGFGYQRFKELCELVCPVERVLETNVQIELSQRHGWFSAFIGGFEAVYASVAYDRMREDCAQKGIELLNILDDAYPKSLREIYDPPLILYVRGQLIPEDDVALAIVGTRRPTMYGLRMAHQFAYELARGGVTVVSGMARGIDGAAHEKALKAKGRTIAVLGCGVDVVYPKNHQNLYHQIVEEGAVVSEYPPRTSPIAFNFPRRNRIINGLSMGTLVVEANQRSGSLITSALAADENREVYAVPGPVDSITSRGTNQLIQKGAKLVLNTQDILEDLLPKLRSAADAARPESSPSDIVSRESDPLLGLFGRDPVLFDQLLIQSKQNSSELYQRLMELELKGRIKRLMGGRYVRSS